MKQVSHLCKALQLFIGRLQMHCDFREEGCEDWIKLDVLDSHLKVATNGAINVVAMDVSVVAMDASVVAMNVVFILDIHERFC